jgi:heat-inducible transcriptional repressor
METQQLSPEERSEIEQRLHEAASSAESLAEAAARLLSRYSGRVGILAIPNVGDTVLEAVSFVPLSGRRVLCVLVSKSGFIEHRLFQTAEPMGFEELVRLSNYLTETYRGKTLRAIRDQLRVSLDQQRDEVFQLLGRQIQLAEVGLASTSPPEVIVEGTAQVVGQVGLAALDQVRRLLDTFAERSRLLALLSQCLEGEGVRVVFGDDSPLTSELGLSLVARPFGADGPARGALGILGPTCMPYERIVPLVDFLGDALSRVLMEGSE